MYPLLSQSRLFADALVDDVQVGRKLRLQECGE